MAYGVSMIPRDSLASCYIFVPSDRTVFRRCPSHHVVLTMCMCHSADAVDVLEINRRDYTQLRRRRKHLFSAARVICVSVTLCLIVKCPTPSDKQQVN